MKKHEMNESTAGSGRDSTDDSADEQPQQTDDAAADAGSESPEEGAAAMADAEDAVVDEGD